MKTYLPLLFLAFFFLTCKNENKPTDQPEQYTQETEKRILPWSNSIDSLAQSAGPCVPDSSCMEVRLSWPIVKGGDENIRTLLNDSITRFLIEHLQMGPAENLSTLEEGVKQLILFFEQERKEQFDFSTNWGIEIDSDISFGEKIANLSINNYAYLGGAHPNSYWQYENFDLKTGKLIQYADFVKDTTAFKTIAEKNFLKVASSMTGEEESIDNFFWDEGFQLAKNFKLEKDTIELLYNPYEAAAYVYGYFEVRIPYSDLDQIIELPE